MSQHSKHLYAIMYPNHALVASQLEPEQFGKQYAVGTKRYYTGKVLFIEVDPEYRNDYFPIEEMLEQTTEHPDGSPKQTKFVSSYRVLEHLSLDCLGKLYAVTVGGQCLGIEPQEYESKEDKGRVKIIQQLNPLQLLVATTYDHRAYGAEMTRADNPKGAPKLFFTQLALDVAAFQEEWRHNPFLPPPIPGVHPQKLNLAIEGLQSESEPANASIGLASVFDQVLYRKVDGGFFLAEGKNLKYYPMPTEADLQRQHYSWWKSTA